MPQYMVAVYDEPHTRSRTPEEQGPIYEAVDKVNQKAVADGIFVFAGGMHEQSASTWVDPRGGSPVVTDGPYLETKDYIGGFWVIEVADLDAALAFARDAAMACQGPVEVRPFMAEPEN